MNIGFGITGSFCTHDKALVAVKQLVDDGYNVIPIITDVVGKTNTRFGSSEKFLKELKQITKNEIVASIVDAEPLGPKNMIDVLVVAPCTGNTLAKLANAITDNAVTMTAKSLMRNNRPIVIGIASNDGLGLNLKNIATLMNSKNVYFVPFKQDDPTNKPKSLMVCWDKIKETLKEAINKNQIQPVLG